MAVANPAAFRRLRVETTLWAMAMAARSTAAFGRLRVETGLQRLYLHGAAEQPPSGDCVLKPVAEGADVEVQAQPSSVNYMSKPDGVFLI